MRLGGGEMERSDSTLPIENPQLVATLLATKCRRRNRNKTSSSPQNLNTLERIVLASGASPDYRNREPRYPEPGLFENDELVGPIVPEEDDEPPDITRTATSSKSPFVEIDLEASPQRQNLMTPKPKKAKKPNPPSPR